jgi:hypothetical protein
MRLSGEGNARLVRDIMTPRARLHVAVWPAGKSLTPEEARAVLHEKRIEKLPLVDENWNVRGVSFCTCVGFNVFSLCGYSSSLLVICTII